MRGADKVFSAVCSLTSTGQPLAISIRSRTHFAAHVHESRARLFPTAVRVTYRRVTEFFCNRAQAVDRKLKLSLSPFLVLYLRRSRIKGQRGHETTCFDDRPDPIRLSADHGVEKREQEEFLSKRLCFLTCLLMGDPGGPSSLSLPSLRRCWECCIPKALFP